MALPLKDKFKTILKLISEPKVLISLLSLRAWGYLVDMGWFNSFKLGRPVDKAEKPIPWFTYPAIEFLSERLNKSLKVFEFGSGNSTLFFTERVNQIVSVEHNKDWYQKIFKIIPSNVELTLTSSLSANDYIQPLINSSSFDVIIVDGLFRNECIRISLKQLTDAGVIILDDSERDEYKEGIVFLIRSGFRQLKFSGIAPGIFFRKCTSIFYKQNNCLGI